MEGSLEELNKFKTEGRDAAGSWDDIVHNEESEITNFIAEEAESQHLSEHDHDQMLEEMRKIFERRVAELDEETRPEYKEARGPSRR